MMLMADRLSGCRRRSRASRGREGLVAGAPRLPRCSQVASPQAAKSRRLTGASIEDGVVSGEVHHEGMSVHIDIAGLRPERVAVVPSPLAELGMALHALSEPGHHPGLQGWVTGVTARLDSHLADRCARRTSCGGRRSRISSCPSPASRAAARPPGSHARRGPRPGGQADGRAVRGRRPGVHLRARPTARPAPTPLGRGRPPARAGAGRRPRTPTGAVHRAAAGRPAADPGLAAPVRGGLRGGVLRGGLVPAAAPARGRRPPQDGPAAPQGPGRGAGLGVPRGGARRVRRADHGRQAGQAVRPPRRAVCCSSRQAWAGRT